jgi:ABC-type dipeptide/oligopeptide/nickel transport system permease component
VIAVYGLLAGSVLSGSFAVEIVTAWPGLGR